MLENHCNFLHFLTKMLANNISKLIVDAMKIFLQLELTLTLQVRRLEKDRSC